MEMELADGTQQTPATGSAIVSGGVPETSIVIRAFNEERWLPELFRALEIQRYRDFEVLVVDSGSIDRTRDIAAANGARIVRLRSEDFTFGYSLNIGIQQARGSLIAIISAHAIPTDEHWLERLVRPLREDSNAMVFGGQRGHPVSKFSEARDFERIFQDTPQIMDDEHVFVNNANSAIKRVLWMEHPFDEGLPGLEDAEWAKYWIPRGLNVVYEPLACVYHVHTESWAQVRHRFHREGIAGRWTAVRIIRHIPSEIFREIRWVAMDLVLALRAGKLRRLTSEILRYRYNKTLGIVKGILDSRRITNPSKRAELHFDKGFSAVVVRGPTSVGIEPRSIPELKPSEILVRVAMVGICPADFEPIEHRTPPDGPRYPFIPGREISGTVVSIGKKVTGLEEGDRVVVESIQGCGSCAACKCDNAVACPEARQAGSPGFDGAYAEYLVTRARYAHRIPDGMTFQQAVITEPLAMVLKGLRKLGAAADSGSARKCAIVGAGVIGCLAARTLSGRGWEVTVFNSDAARSTSCHPAIKVESSLAELGGFDLLIETGTAGKALSGISSQLRKDVTVLSLGQLNVKHLNVGSLCGFDRTIVTTVGSSGADVEAALTILPHLDTRALFQCDFPLEDFSAAWSAARANSQLKVVLRVDPGAV